MSSRNIPKKSPIRRHQRVCTLEIIEEGRELQSTSRNSLSCGTARGTNGCDFTPFQSSWEQNCSTTSKPPDSKTEENLRQQLKSLENDFEDLLDITRLERLEDQKKMEQMKTDYEFMLESQKKSFKIREKELLEQIDYWKMMTETVQQSSIEKESQTSIPDTFEYEEMSEKLESFERQNRLLQSNKETLEHQNGVLINTLAQIIKSFASLESKYNKLNIKNKLLQHIRLNMQLTVNKPETEHLSESKKIEENTKVFSNFLKMFRTKFDDNNRIENISECNYMNLSDSEKINKNSIYSEPTEESKTKTDNVNSLIKYSKLLLENNMRHYRELHETTNSKDQEMLNALEIVAALNKERQHQKIENARLINLNQDKDEIILELETKQSKIEKDNKTLLKWISFLRYLMHSQTTELKKLCELLLDNPMCLNGMEGNEESQMKKYQQSEEDCRNCPKYEIEKCKILEHETNGLEIERLIENNMEIFNQSLHELRQMFTQLKQKNINFEETISKISVHMQALKKEYKYCKETYVEEIPKQFKSLEADIHTIKEVYEHAIKLTREESEEKSSIIQKLHEQLEEFNEKTENENSINDTNKLKASLECGSGSICLNCKNKITNCEEKSERLDGKYSKFSGTTIKTNILQNWNFSVENEGNKTVDKDIECRRSNRWKQNRNRDHDRRRSIDSISSCFETTE